MKHFDRKDWIAFKNGTLPQVKRTAMADHLLICGRCLDVFLDSFDPDDLLQAEAIIPDGFAAAVLQACRVEEKAAAKTPSARKGWRDWLVYYVAASVVTLVLVQSGIFQLLLDKTPQVTRRPQQERHLGTVDTSWADVVTGKLAALINEFEATK